jgi:hypothetical protein
MSSAPPAPAVRALNCPNCGGAIEVRAAGYTVNLICGHCGSTLDATDPALKVIQASTAALKRPRIALGTHGILRGVEWQAVGYMERAAEDGGWAEYLLFNPYLGYSFLIDDGEAFYFTTLLDRVPTEGADQESRVYQGHHYAAAEDGYYRATVTFVVGEFYWRVAVGEQVDVTEYEYRDYGLSSEENADERTWSWTEPLRSGEAEKAFKAGPPVPFDSPPEPDDGGGARGKMAAVLAAAAAAEAAKEATRTKRAASAKSAPLKGKTAIREEHRARVIAIWKVAGIALIVLLLAAFLRGSPKLLMSKEVEAPLDGPQKTVVLGPLDLPDSSTAIRVEADAPSLDNSWIDLDYSLVDRKTQENFDAYGAAEHYSGSDSDGSWTEGSAADAASFAAIGKGQYDLVVDFSAHKWDGSSSSPSSSTASAIDASGANASGQPADPFNGLTAEQRAELHLTTPAAPLAPPAKMIPVKIDVYRGASFFSNFFLAFLAIILWPPLIWWIDRKRLGLR